MDADAVLVATCLASALGCLLMGLYANYPIALAPGMGLNAYFVAMATGVPGLSWQIVLGAVFCSGILMLILSVLPVREWVLNSMPRSQKLGIVAGIGFFLALIGLRNAGIVVGSEATMVALGNVTEWPVLLALLGFAAIVALEDRNVLGAVLACILAVAALGWIFGLSPAPESLLAAPPSLAPTALKLDAVAAIELGLLAIVFAFLMVDLFDSSATLAAVLSEAGLTDEDGRVPRLRRALVADSTATMAGAMLGTSTTTSYVESAAGVRAGGRTGLTAVVVAGLFLLATLIAPVATSVPAFATGARDPLRRLRANALASRNRLGRPHRLRPRDGHRAGHAVHLLDRHRDRPRLHHLRAGQGAGRARARAELGVGRGGSGVHAAVRAYVVIVFHSQLIIHHRPGSPINSFPLMGGVAKRKRRVPWRATSPRRGGRPRRSCRSVRASSAWRNAIVFITSV